MIAQRRRLGLARLPRPTLRRRRLPRRRLPRRRVPRRRTAIRAAAVLATLGLLALGGWVWLRSSPLVAVERVTITGVSGPDASQIRMALLAAARNMTTLNVRMSALRTAVAPYPVVKDLQVRTQFPHGLRIHVIEQVPIAAVTAAGRAIAVAADGTLLRDITPAPSLPVIPLPAPPGGPRLTDAAALAAVALVAAAPSPLLAKISQVTDVQSHGLTAQVRGGPSIYFGDATAGDAKWAAAAAVLADPGSAGATYIDVTDPHRPVAGAPAPQQTSAAAQPATTTSTGSG